MFHNLYRNQILLNKNRLIVFFFVNNLIKYNAFALQYYFKNLYLILSTKTKKK